MQAFSRWQRRHSLTILFLGAAIGPICWLTAGATPAWAQSLGVSTGSIRMVKGAGPIKYAPSSAGVQVRAIKGTERTDYVLRPRIAVATPQPARTNIRANRTVPWGGGARDGSRTESIVLPPIQEAREAPSRAADWGCSATLAAGRALRDSGNNEQSLTAKVVSSSAPVGAVYLRSESTASQVRKTSVSASLGADVPSSEPETTPLRSTKEKAAAGTLIPIAPASSRTAEPRSTQGDETQDRSDRDALYNMAVLQVIATVAASLIVSVAIVVSVFVVLRRLGQEMPALVRVPAPALAQSEPPPMPLLVPPPIAEESTAETFDLGLTYEEERRLQEEAERQQEQAVLRTIFEDNLKLRQQLSQLELAAA